MMVPLQSAKRKDAGMCLHSCDSARLSTQQWQEPLKSNVPPCAIVKENRA